MRYGGLGGLGGFPPQRYGTPNSGWVQSDDEFTSEWQSRAPAQFIGGTPAEYRHMAVDGHRPGDTPSAGLAARPKPPSPPGATSGGAGSFQTWTPGDPIQYGNIRVLTNPGTTQTLNPAWEEWNTNFQRAQGLRQENQTRQQQAYDSMRNNGALNGVMPQFYNQPGYGQVSGTTGQFNANGGTQVEGVDNSWTSGAYVPRPGMNGAYNPTPYAAGQFNNPEWKL